MRTTALKISRFGPECQARLTEELPLPQWSLQERIRLEMAVELVSYGIPVYLIEWEGESRLEDVLPGNCIGEEIVCVVEGYQVWSADGRNFATASRLTSYMDTRTCPGIRRQKELVY